MTLTHTKTVKAFGPAVVSTYQHPVMENVQQTANCPVTYSALVSGTTRGRRLTALSTGSGAPVQYNAATRTFSFNPSLIHKGTVSIVLKAADGSLSSVKLEHNITLVIKYLCEGTALAGLGGAAVTPAYTYEALSNGKTVTHTVVHTQVVNTSQQADCPVAYRVTLMPSNTGLLPTTKGAIAYNELTRTFVFTSVLATVGDYEM